LTYDRFGDFVSSLKRRNQANTANVPPNFTDAVVASGVKNPSAMALALRELEVSRRDNVPKLSSG
jgi:hypothetical protein